VEQPPQSRSTPPPPPAAPKPPVENGPPRADGAAAPASPDAPQVVILVCPECSEPRQADARYCEECGHDFGTDPVPPPPTEERSRISGPVLWLIVAFWAILAVGGLWFLYSALFSL
jgi:hypothetical protein